MKKVIYLFSLTILLFLLTSRPVIAQTGVSCDEVNEACCVIMGGYDCSDTNELLKCSNQALGGVCIPDQQAQSCDQIGEPCCLGLGGYQCNNGLICSDRARAGGTCQANTTNQSCDQIGEQCCTVMGGYDCVDTNELLKCSNSATGGQCVPDQPAQSCDALGEACCLGLGGYQCNNGLVCSNRATAGGVCQLNTGVPQNTRFPECASEGSQSVNGIPTALGCIPIDSINDFISALLTRGSAIAGGIAFLLLIWGTLQVITSRGDPGKLAAGRETITASLAGIIFLIFSIFIYQFIAERILGIL